MNVTITGGAGFLGRRLAARLRTIADVTRIRLVDIQPPPEQIKGHRVEALQCDLLDPEAARAAVDGSDVIFHLAAMVSGPAEANFDLGMRVNIDGTRAVLEAARAGGKSPRFVFTSSLAVFGPPLPKVITDSTAVTPKSSYGMEKAVGELLVSEYSRRGFVDGRILRLPTVCVRPGKPNGAASSFVSGIIREPLNGEEAICPVQRDLELWLTSPDSAVGALAHAAILDSALLGESRTLNVPGLTVTVGQMIDQLSLIAGTDTAARIRFREDKQVERIVCSWPSRFDTSRATALGFTGDSDFGQVIKSHIRDELPSLKVRSN